MPDKRIKHLSEMIAGLRVFPGSDVTLARDHDPGYKSGWVKKREGKEYLQSSVELLSEYQERLAAQDTYGLLVVLQGIDAAGKDGTIRHVMSGVNPQGVTVRSFKVPSSEELNHDFLWRYQSHLPGRGQIGIFNRSHYEEVLVVRVHPEELDNERLPTAARRGAIWQRRYDDINAWEHHLVDSGIRIVKLFLNISREEQRTRFLKRIDLAEKNWKFSPADIAERAYWDDYQRAFSEMLTHTSTDWAPWYVIPSDHKWFARITVGAVIVHALAEIDPQYPKIDSKTRKQLRRARRQLVAEAPKGAHTDPFKAGRK